MKRKVLFLCETNGLYSPMAEAMLNRMDSEHFDAVSASTSWGRMHPFTVEVMKEIGIDLSPKTPQHVMDLRDDLFDYVITLDDNSARAFRNFQREKVIHWKLDDPVVAPVDSERQLRAFRMTRDQISLRLRFFVIVHVRPRARSASAA